MFINPSNASRAAVFVLLMALALAGCGSSNSATAPSGTNTTMPGSNSATVTIPAASGAYGSGMSTFAPGTVTIPAGGSVTWQNNDGDSHVHV